MKTLKNDWLIWIIILTPYLFVAYFWKQFPEQIPTHFGIDGAPDDYSGKAVGLMLFPGVNILMYIFFLVMPKIDPSKKGQVFYQDKNKYMIVRAVIHSMMSFVFMTVVFYSLGYHFNITTMIFYGMLVFFLLLGNYMGNVRHNYFIGIRTPWTLSNEAVWTSTHRLTAKLWVLSSILMMAVLPFVSTKIASIAFMIYVGTITIIPVVYSYLEFKKQKQHE